MGRFTTCDPLFEKYYGWSPYVYSANNPINIKDDNGKWWVEVHAQMAYIAAKYAGLNDAETRFFVDGMRYVDDMQTPEDQCKHGVLSQKLLDKGVSKNKQIYNGFKFFSNQVKDYYNTNSEFSLFYLGMGLHFESDLICPSHFNWQIWDDTENPFAILSKASHTAGDFPVGTLGWAAYLKALETMKSSLLKYVREKQKRNTIQYFINSWSAENADPPPLPTD